MDLSFSDAEDDIGALEVTSSPSREELLPLLECPVCFDLPLPPIRTCYQGHIICAECCPKLSGCPLCQKPIGFGRNFFAEEFISKSTIRCKYHLDGCSLLLAGANVKQHIKECTFRPIECQNCQIKICFRDFEKHLQVQHNVSRWDINENGNKILEEGINRFKTGGDTNLNCGSYYMYRYFFKSLIAAITLSFVIDYFTEVS